MPEKWGARGRSRIQNLESSFCPARPIMAALSFRPLRPFGYTQAPAARAGFSSRPWRAFGSELLTAEIAKKSRRVRGEDLPEGAGGNAGTSRAVKGALERKRPAGIIPPARFPFWLWWIR